MVMPPLDGVGGVLGCRREVAGNLIVSSHDNFASHRGVELEHIGALYTMVDVSVQMSSNEQ